MLSLSTIAFIFSILGSIAAGMFFISPILMIIKLHKTRKTEDVSEFVFILSAINCVSWTINFARIIPLDYPPFLINALGLILNYTYYSIFSAYKYDSPSKYIFIFGSALTLCGIGLVEYYLWENAINGWISMSFNILMYGSSLQKLVEVFHTKDYTLLPIVTSLVQIFCGCCWVIYGTIKRYIFVIVPNVMGIGFGLIGTAVYFYFAKEERLKLTVSLIGKESTLEKTTP